MSLRKEQKLTAKSLSQQQQVVEGMQNLLNSIERAEKSLSELKADLELAKANQPEQRTTQQDIEYLNALLKCAHKKLGWEKQVASLKKRVPEMMQEIAALMNDPSHPPSEEMCASLLQALQQLKSAMERLEATGVH